MRLVRFIVGRMGLLGVLRVGVEFFGRFLENFFCDCFGDVFWFLVFEYCGVFFCLFF